MPSDSADGFRSAEDWLQQQGVTRDPIRVDTSTLPPSPPAPDPTPETTGDGAPATGEGADDGDRPEPLEDAVSRAVGFIRRSTAMHPASEARLRDKLADRDTPARVIELALERARRERLVDDRALTFALAEERRAKGHAATRIRMDLRQKGLPEDLVAEALAGTEREDPEAVAFGVAREKAPAYAHLDAEVAFRRLVAYLGRRGHPEGLARKVAREVVYVEREAERTAGR
jgi:regulatory protein